MAAAKVARPASALPEAAAGPGDGEAEAQLFERMKELQRQLEFLEIQEGYVKEETKSLRRELLRAQEEVKRIQSVPLVIGRPPCTTCP